jgi:hypothetical protein
MNDLRIRTMRPDEISIAVDGAASQGWNPGLADAACFATVDPDGFIIGELDGAPAATVSCVSNAREATRVSAPLDSLHVSWVCANHWPAMVWAHPPN